MADAYRYGFNGKEKEDGINIDNYDFGARIYDGRVGRWLSVDPMAAKYPNIAPYTAFANAPLFFVDEGGETLTITPEIHIQYKQALAILSKSPTAMKIIEQLEKSQFSYQVVKAGGFVKADNYDSRLNNAVWNPDAVQKIFDNNGKEIGVRNTSAILLIHELIHAYQDDMLAQVHGEEKVSQILDKKTANVMPYYSNQTEYEAIQIENIIAKEIGELPRPNHQGQTIPTPGGNLPSIELKPEPYKIENVPLKPLPKIDGHPSPATTPG